MTDSNRREFLKKLAKSAVYTAPVIATFAAPPDLLGQGKSSQHKKGGGKSGMAAPAPGPAAPWNAPPPGSNNP